MSYRWLALLIVLALFYIIIFWLRIAWIRSINKMITFTIEDSNTERRRLFDHVDACGYKIYHVGMPDEDARQTYTYVDSGYAFDSYKIPPHEMIHSIRFRDYFHIGRLSRSGVVYCKTDYLGCQPSASVLVTGSSDIIIDDRLAGLHRGTWFATHADTTAEHVRGLPLGLTSYDPRTMSDTFLFQFGDNTPSHAEFADDSMIVNAWGRPKSSRWNMYANFSVHTFSDRLRIWNELAQQSHVRCVEPTVGGRQQFLYDIREADHVVCPRGNGIDTHRFWESLYVGAVPVVERSRVVEWFSGLPFVAVDQMGADMVVPELGNGSADYHKLYMSYWIEQIERSACGM